ncbi:MAG: hypothetical protein RL145_28, partial [Pseudomonadota bacterium]
SQLEAGIPWIAEGVGMAGMTRQIV